MTVTTSKGKTFPIDWMYDTLGTKRGVRLQLHDSRPLSEIAADFEACDHLHRASDTEGDLDFDGYTDLTTVIRPAAGTVQLTLEKP